MIPSLTNQTQDEVMAEFDSVFGGSYIKWKIPTTYRKRGKVDKVFILLPDGIEINQLIEDLGLSLGERYLLMVSYLYVRGLLWKKEAKQIGNFFALHRDILRRLGGEQYKRLITYGLKQKHIIKSGKTPKKLVQSIEYRLNEKVLTLKKQHRYQLQTKPATSARSQFIKERKQKFIENGPAYKKISLSLDGLTFDYLPAIKFVAGLPDGEKTEHNKREYRRNFIEKLLLDYFGLSVDKQGRNYNFMVSAPKDIRKYFYYGQTRLHVVDISSSQPLLHLALYPKDCPEKVAYKKLLEDGDFWEHMNETAGSPVNLLEPDERSKFKKLIFQQVFYFRGTFHGGKIGPYADMFRKEFPILWDAIEEAKRRGSKGKPSSTLAKAMQEAEADAVRAALEKLMNNPYPLISIHDAIVTTEDGVADVRQAILDSYAVAGIVPPLTIKRLSA